MNELKDKAFGMLDSDAAFTATAGAVYNYGYAGGMQEGRKQGVAEGRSYMWHWSFPLTLLVVGTGGIFIGAAMVSGWVAMGVL
jgi:uncharacterized protein YfiM (DUF2279 family)